VCRSFPTKRWRWSSPRRARGKHTSDGDGALPPLDRIVLNGDGTLTLAPTDAADGDCVGQLARLLHALLVPDTSSRRPVPGPLLLVVARAAGEIDLPRPSAAEFERLLSRYGAADPMLLSAIHRRCVAAWSARRTEVGRRDAVRETARPVPVRCSITRVRAYTRQWPSRLRC
jgi:hypothetical protein